MTHLFAPRLLGWYKRHQRDLPWRHAKDPYHIWVSEMMLQQTTVATVIPYYERWIKLFPTVESLANADIHHVLKAWQGLGYYNRAKNLHKAAQVVHREYNGILPKDPDLVRALPGFGPYSTGSTLSIAYNVPLTIIDANVRRVIMRILALEGYADTTQDKIIDSFLNKVLPNKEVGDFNQALMELGALVCRTKEPICIQCPIQSFCKAFKQGTQEIIPKPKKKETKDIAAVVALIQQGKKYFIQQRPPKGLLADLWEFPGGKVEKGETKEHALKREINEELGVAILKSKHLFDVTHFYTQFRVKLAVFACTCTPAPQVNATHQWVTLKNISNYPMPSGSAKILACLHKKYKYSLTYIQ